MSLELRLPAWLRLGVWPRQSSLKFRIQTVLLFLGVTGFSIAMYRHAWISPTTVTLAGVMAALVAVSTSTIQAYIGFSQVFAAKGETNQTVAIAVAVCQGIWAVVTCAGMVAILLIRGPRLTKIDLFVSIAAGGCFIVGIGLLIIGEKAWAKLAIFSMKVVWQLGQSLLITIYGTEELVFIGCFIALSLFVGFLRESMAREGHKTPAKLPLTETGALVWCWRMDIISFIFMAWCLLGMVIFGPLV